MRNVRDPWIKFFPADWRADPGLRMCSLAARGLWMEILSLMHEAEPYGYLLVAGKPPSDQQISVMAGCSIGELRKLRAELRDAGVPSIAEDGTWFSRRMVRDAHRREVNRKNGRGGGNPALTDKASEESRLTEPDNRDLFGAVKADRPRLCEGAPYDRDPEARSQKEHSDPDGSGWTARAGEDGMAEVWRLGLGILAEAGKAEKPARALIGRWRSKHGDRLLAEAIRRCREAGPIEPIAFIEGVFRGGSNGTTDEADSERSEDRVGHALRLVAGPEAAP